jgi:transcriptional regulator with XRE-family HTH domain
MQQSVIARLERGDQPPSLATLARITAGTGIALHLDVSNGAVAVTG